MGDGRGVDEQAASATACSWHRPWAAGGLQGPTQSLHLPVSTVWTREGRAVCTDSPPVGFPPCWLALDKVKTSPAGLGNCLTLPSADCASMEISSKQWHMRHSVPAPGGHRTSYLPLISMCTCASVSAHTPKTT